MDLHNVTLEMSLKPFRSMKEPYVRTVCRDLFTQWLALLRQADGVSVMLWIADGSEILEYTGDPEQSIEWARYIGAANPPKRNIPGDTDGTALHSRAYLYMDNPPEVRVRDLVRIVRCLKQEGRGVTGLPVRVGATFDPGPEFARSAFKYERHPEICLANTMGAIHRGFVTCYATLHADDHAYAGFPDGIPEGTSVGTFFGRQCRRFLEGLDFDYIWFSNGFGFGLETWRNTGALFDGERFTPEKAGEVRNGIIGFWNDFRLECPRHRIETRGTNLCVGADLATDGCPLRDIYRGDYNLAPPPNSPWAALNGDFGLEMVGYLTRIAEVPDEDRGFPFRFYTHDPWWMNSPWLDRYNRSPHDIYLPLAIGRIDAAGAVCNPTAIEFLTVDDSYGRMPDQVPNEVIPHVLEAVDHAPDAPGPIVWVYPFDEYHDRTFGVPERLPEVFFGDWFIRCAVNQGLPVNTVVTTGNFLTTLRERLGLYKDLLLLTPVPDAGTALEAALLGFVDQGGGVLLYGPLAHAGTRLLDYLGLRLETALDGEFHLELPTCSDRFGDTPSPRRVHHRSLVSAGGIRAISVAESATVCWTVDAAHETTGLRRVLARCSTPGNGRLGWVRGTNPFTTAKAGHLPRMDDPARYLDSSVFLRWAAAELGGPMIAVDKSGSADRTPIFALARKRNGLFISGYWPDTTRTARLRFPLGAPLPVGLETRIEDGASLWCMPRWCHAECRVFVDAQNSGIVSCIERHSGAMGIRRRLRVTGLDHARLRFLPETGTEDRVDIRLGSIPEPYLGGDVLTPKYSTHNGGAVLEIEDVSGAVLISW